MPATPSYPHDAVAERAVLAAMVLDRECLHEGLERLEPDHFFVTPHREVFCGLLDLFQGGAAVDAVTLAEALRRRGTLSEVGGLPLILSLVEDVTTVASFSHHVELVERKYLLRALIKISGEIAERAAAGRDEADLLLDEAEAKVFGIAERRIRRDFVAVGDVIGGVFDAVEARSRRQEHISGVETGYPEIDDLTSGLQRQNLVIVAARPGVGKTAFALNIAQNVAVNRRLPVAIFSLEMSNEALAQRLLCTQAKVSLSAVRSGKVPSNAWEKLTEAMNALSRAPIYLDDSPALNILEMRAKARRIKARHDVQLVIVDYLQLVHGHGRYESRQVEIAAVSSFLKSLSKELNVPVVACAQLSRAVERRTSGEPQLSDLRESGAIEQDADLVMFLHAPSEREGEEGDPDYAAVDVIIAKQRNGPTGRVKLMFIKKYTRFERAEFTAPAAGYDYLAEGEVF